MAEKANSVTMTSAQNQDELKVTERSPNVLLVSQEEAAPVSTSCSDNTPVVLSFAEEQVNNARKLVKCSSRAEQIETQPASYRVALLSFMSTNDADSSFKHIQSEYAYSQALGDFVRGCSDDGVQTRMVVHVLTTDDASQPVVGGIVVSESDLYGPLNSCLEDAASRTLVFQLTYQMKGSFCSGCSGKSSARKENPNRASYCGVEVYRFDIQSGANLLKLHEHLSQVFGEVQAQGTVANGEEMSRRIVEGCRSSVRLATACGFPSAELSQTPSDAEVPGIPIVAGNSQDASSSFEQLVGRSPTECNTLNIACGVVIKSYGDGHKRRDGAEKDFEHITETARLLGCHPTNIHVLYDDNSMISKETVLSHIRETLERYDSVNNALVFISAHGDTEGFKSSDGDSIRVEEVVKPFRKIAASVQLFYQACRGPRQHSAKKIRLRPAPFVAGVSFDCPDVSGCCLPSSLHNCGAIFASPCGYVAYRNGNDGSWMLSALRHVASCLEGHVSVRQLAHLVQARIHVTTPYQGGKMRLWSERKGSEVQNFLQLQYSVNGSGELRIH